MVVDSTKHCLLEIELVIVYYVIACARDYIESLIVIALDTIIPGSRVIHKRRHSSRHPRRPRAIKYSSFPILYMVLRAGKVFSKEPILF